jgi:ElaB/YqjD/DUF883 family membrane-anchored ribosome-binding protein
MTQQRLFQTFDDVTSAAGSAVNSVADAARQAEGIAREASARAAGAVRDGAQQAAEQLRTAGDRLSDQASAAADQYACVARNAAERIGTLVGRVRTIRREDVTAEVKDFVARHPASLVGAAVAGFLLGRMARNR